MIKVYFPEEKIPYYVYEALQIFGTVENLVTLIPSYTKLMLQLINDDGDILRTDLITDETRKAIKRQVYIVMTQYTGYESPWGCMTGIRPAKTVNQLERDGLNNAEVLEYLLDVYKIREDKARLAIETAATQADANMLTGERSSSIGFYAGVPFCPTRCLYCSFTSNPIEKYYKSVDKYIDLIGQEIKETAALIKEHNLSIESLYIGGGTPTSLNEAQLQSYLNHLTDNLDLSRLAEFCLEAGRPDSINEEKLRISINAGVNRISINPQTMNDITLEAIGRCHTSEQTVKAFYQAREAGFNNINMDIIAGLPGEDERMFEYTLEQINKLQPDSLTVHTLSIKRAAMLRFDADALEKLSFSVTSNMVDMARAFATSLGLRPYYMYRQKNMLGNLENVAYCRKGCESPYNIHIMEEDQTILAVGAGAVTKVVYSNNRIERAFNVKSVEDYLRRMPEMIERKRLLLDNNI